MAWGSWNFRKSSLKWYQYLWAALPLGLLAAGGALGGGLGAAAFAVNLQLMQGKRGSVQKYLFTGLSSAAAAVAYLAIAMFLVSPLGLGLGTSAAVEQQMRKVPLYATIQKTDPATYSKIRDVITNAANHRNSQAEISAAVQPYIVQMVAKYIAFASNASAIQQGNVASLEIDQINAKDTDACFKYLNPQPGAPAINTSLYLTKEVLQSDMANSAAIVQSGATNPQPKPTVQEITPALRIVRNQLVRQFGEANVENLAHPNLLARGKDCEITSAFYKQILMLPAAESGPVLRYIFSQRSAV